MIHALTHLAEATGQSKAFMAINALLGCLQHIKRKGPSRQQENAAKKRVCAEVSQTPETTKPAKRRALRCSNMAEAMGFELMDLLQSTVFKTVALNHSATPPNVVAGAIIPE
jgi:hypothetical protein